MSKLLIYNASAGAGKTYTLVFNYLRSILADPDPDTGAATWSPYQFARILCITFTRKATAEMKQRIVEALYALATGASPMATALANDTGLAQQTLTLRAQRALHAILHDYSRLAVATIDSFIQRMVQTLLWELQLNANINISLDKNRMLELATEALLTNLKPNSEAYRWILSNALLRTEQQANWKIANKIQQHGALIFSEAFLNASPAQRQQIFSLANSNTQRKTLDAIATNSQDALRTIPRQLTQLLQDHQIDPQIFAYGKNSFWFAFLDKFVKAPLDPLPPLKARALNAYEDFNTWLPKKIRDDKNQQATISLLETQIYPSYRRFVERYLTLAPIHNTATQASTLLPEVALLSTFRQAFSQVEKQHATQLIDDLALLLIDLAAQADTSFIYERMGLYYDALFIDEFQDTSRTHWKLLQPFIINSLAQGHTSMLVGDIKQAIYRWRGGDWQILAQEIPQQFAKTFGTDQKVLPANYRSHQQIIAFNNQFFPSALQALRAYCEDKINSLPPNIDQDQVRTNLYQPFEAMLTHAYQGAVQQVAHPQWQQGYIELATPLPSTPAQPDENDGNATPYPPLHALTLERMEHLLDTDHVTPGNIAILVRRRSTATQLATTLLLHAKQRGSRGYGIVSQDALLLDAAPDVQTLLAAMRIVANRADDTDRTKVARHIFNATQSDSNQWTQPAEWLVHPALIEAQQWLEQFRAYPLLQLFDALTTGLALPSSPGQTPYLSALRDRVFAFQNDRSASLHAFLTAYQNENPASRALELPASPNAINILTIHRSKGLEFDHVICPEIDWPFSSPLDLTLLWNTKPLPEPLPPTLPVKMGSTAYNTLLYAEALQEEWFRAIDALNLIYVAFTRAKKRLYLEVIPKQKGGVYKTLLETPLQKIDWHTQWSTSTHAFQAIGAQSGPNAPSLTPPDAPTSPLSRINPTSLHTQQQLFTRVSIATKMALTAKDTTRFSDLIARQAAQTLGNTLHDLLAAYTSPENLLAALERTAQRNHLPDHWASRMQRTIMQQLDSQPLANAFDPGTPTLAERSIITPKGKIYRPDRVALLPEQTLIIDFKFGAPQPSHSEQIKRYIDLLRQMQHPNPQGLLWYIDPHNTTSRTVAIPG